MTRDRVTVTVDPSGRVLVNDELVAEVAVGQVTPRADLEREVMKARTNVWLRDCLRTLIGVVDEHEDHGADPDRWAVAVVTHWTAGFLGIGDAHPSPGVPQVAWGTFGPSEWDGPQRRVLATVWANGQAVRHNVTQERP